jgi:hypothetical protein
MAENIYQFIPNRRIYKWWGGENSQQTTKTTCRMCKTNAAIPMEKHANGKSKKQN